MKNFVKRIMGMVMTVLVAVAILGGVQAQHAEAYDKYWNGDTNYYLLDGKMGTTIYLDESSVTIKNNDDVAQIWAENFVYVNENNVCTGTKTVWFGTASGVFYVSTDGDNWTQFSPGDNSGNMTARNNGFKRGYYVAFGHGYN